MAEQPPQAPAAQAAAAAPDPVLAAAAAAGGGVGATITHTYAERAVRVYGVSESEIDALAMYNTLATVFVAVMSSLIAYAIGIWTNAAFAEKLTPAGEVLSKVVGPWLCVLAGVFALLAIWAIWRRHSTWKEIKKESKAS